MQQLEIGFGRRLDVVKEIAAAGGRLVLDVHSDPWHHRSVLTLAEADGSEGALEEAVREPGPYRPNQCSDRW